MLRFLCLLFVYTVNASWCANLCTQPTHICNSICGTNYIHALELENTLFERELIRWKTQATLPPSHNTVQNLQLVVDKLQVDLEQCLDKEASREEDVEVEGVEMRGWPWYVPLLTGLVVKCCW